MPTSSASKSSSMPALCTVSYLPDGVGLAWFFWFDLAWCGAVWFCLAEAIRGNQRQSEAIRSNQRQSEAIRGSLAHLSAVGAAELEDGLGSGGVLFQEGGEVVHLRDWGRCGRRCGEIVYEGGEVVQLRDWGRCGGYVGRSREDVGEVQGRFRPERK